MHIIQHLNFTLRQNAQYLNIPTTTAAKSQKQAAVIFFPQLEEKLRR